MIRATLSLFLCLSFVSLNACEKHQQYLQRGSFKVRQQQAAAFLERCDTIIEIGGGKNPISKYVNNKKVIVIDPAIKRKEEDGVRHIPISFQRWNEPIESTNYGVVILGMKLEKLQRPDWLKLYTLIENAKKTVLECSAENQEAKKAIKAIIKNANQVEVEETSEMDLSEKRKDEINVEVEGSGEIDLSEKGKEQIHGQRVFAKRKIYFLKRKE